jgi:hypothetical protein
MDEILLPYFQSASEAEKQQCLDELLQVHASPVVKNTLRERLGFHISIARATSRNQEAEDLYHEVLAKIVELLRGHCQLNVLKRLDHQLRPARALWSSVDWRSLPKKHRSQLQLPFPRGRILISSHRGIRKLGTGAVPHGSVRQ